MLQEEDDSSLKRPSLAVCALDFNCAANRIACVNAGFPRPMVAGRDGFARPLGGEVGYPPLGWFPENYQAFEQEKEIGSYYLWSDGLSDHAEKLGVDPLSLAHHLLSQDNSSSKWVLGSLDDILVARVVDPCRKGLNPNLPLVSVAIPGDQLAAIDSWQNYFEQSLRVALKSIDGDRLAEVLICLREGLINGLKHGCRERPDESVNVQIALLSEDGELAVLIQDPGTGHDFDTRAHIDRIGDDLVVEHRGLVILESIPNRMSILNGGSAIRMEFSLN